MTKCGRRRIIQTRSHRARHATMIFKGTSLCSLRSKEQTSLIAVRASAAEKNTGGRSPQGRKEMKKILTAVTAALAAVILAVAFAACSTSYVGTYKLGSMKMVSGGMTIEYVAGQAYNGVTISEDACTLEIKDDETWTMSMNLAGMTNDSEGTWSTNDDGDLVLSAGGDDIVVKLDGKQLVFEIDAGGGMNITLTMNKK